MLFVIFVGCASSIIGVISELSADPSTSRPFMLMVPVFIGICIGAIVLICGLIVGLHVWAYKHLYYEMGPEEFNLYSGILNKKRVHVPYTRIQTVDQRATLIQRLFGVCNVSIDTAGGASNKAILVPYLSKEQAQILKNELYTRKMMATSKANPSASTSPTATDASAYPPALSTPYSANVAPTAAYAGAQEQQTNILDTGERIWNEVGGVFAGNDIAMEPVTYEYGLSNKELIFTGLSNNTSVVVIIMMLLASILQFAGGIFEIFPDAEESIFNTAANTIATMTLEHAILSLVLFFAGVMVVIWIISSLGACITYGGFHARRRGERVEVERGLLQHQSQSVSIDRIQSVVITQSFIRRLLGYCELGLGKVDAAEDTSNSNTNAKTNSGVLVIHPFLKVKRIDGILKGLVPEYADIPTELEKVSARALRRGLIRECIWQGSGFWIAVPIAIMQIIINVVVHTLPAEDLYELFEVIPYLDMFAAVMYCLAVLLFIWDVANTCFWAKESGFAMNRRFMLIRNGGLSRKTVCFPKRKIQFGYKKTNPLQRMANTATICAVTAAGVGGTSTKLIDASQSDADAWLDWLKPEQRGEEHTEEQAAEPIRS